MSRGNRHPDNHERQPHSSAGIIISSERTLWSKHISAAVTTSTPLSSASSVFHLPASTSSIVSSRASHITAESGARGPESDFDPITAEIIKTALPLLSSAVPSSETLNHGIPNPLASTLARDSMLVYARRMFHFPPVSNDGDSSLNARNITKYHREHLLPLLYNLRSVHPRYAPVLLLLGCTYHAIGDFAESVKVNDEILSGDGDYVEALSNKAAAFRLSGELEKAIECWWKTVNHSPLYWDAVNNLLEALVYQEQERIPIYEDRMYTEALRLCEMIRLHIPDAQPKDMPQFRNILHICGSIRCLPKRMSIVEGMKDFIVSLESLLHRATQEASKMFSFRTLLLAEHMCALLSTSSVSDTMATFAANLGFEDMNAFEKDGRLLDFIDAGSEDLWQLVVEEGFGLLQAVFITPVQAARTLKMIFSGTFGVFPSLCVWSDSSNGLQKPSEDAVRMSCEMASNTLLSAAKALQDANSPTIVLHGFRDPVCLSPSFTLLLHYLAHSIHPTPSSCNNLGIILSTTPWTEERASEATSVARLFYEEGLKLDPNHPHILTNYGSLKKELGDMEGAIELYRRAVEASPDFDKALSNLANALNDVGSLTESIPIYRRAIDVNKESPEAMCGLVHASRSVADWRGFGHIGGGNVVDAAGCLVHIGEDEVPDFVRQSWPTRLEEVSQEQVHTAYLQNCGVVRAMGTIDNWISWIEESSRMRLSDERRAEWASTLEPFFRDREPTEHVNEGGFVIRMVEWLIRHLQWKWYVEQLGDRTRAGDAPPQEAQHDSDVRKYSRPEIPPSLKLHGLPSVLPFHTFAHHLEPRTNRLIANRNALRVSHLALTRPWMPVSVYRPPSPPNSLLNVGYVSSDFIDHPMAHLMTNVFGNHNKDQFRIFAYSLTGSDGSQYRQGVVDSVDAFRDVSSWSTQQIVEHIVNDEIHILVNLNGYTKGARNDVFAARPSPLQISMLGFSGTLAAGWCDYIVGDPVVCPPSTRVCKDCEREVGMRSPLSHLRPVSSNVCLSLGPDPEAEEDWTYTERFIYMPHTYLATDHEKAYHEGLSSQQQWKKRDRQRTNDRRELFPDVFEDTIIFANFNQMYKLDPALFAVWLRILKRVPNSILWMIRFPLAGEENIRRTARQWEGAEIEQRMRFADIVNKEEHMKRCGLADIFLDTVECNAHTVAADVLWSGTPIITWPKYSHKMCSRVTASIAFATGYGHQMVTDSFEAYEERAVSLALSVTPTQFGRTRVGSRRHGELEDLRRNLFLKRESMPLFDSERWTRNLEKGYKEAWKRWEKGGTTTHFEIEGRTNHQYEQCNGYIWIRDDQDETAIRG